MEAVTQSSTLTDEEKRSFLKSIYKNYGRTALCLSGGAGFGYYHLGVVRALLQAGVLPTVITGTSAGALLGMYGASTVWNLRGAAPFQITNFFACARALIYTAARSATPHRCSLCRRP